MNTINNISNRSIKRMAKGMLKDCYPECVAVVLVGTILQMAPSVLITSFTNNDIWISIADILGALIGVFFTLAFSNYFLSVFRGKKPSIERVTEVSGSFFECLLMNFVAGIRIFLWSLLLIVPGIIEMLKQSQMHFVMVDHPDGSALYCIAESKRLMRGNCLKYFGLQLSFIGWWILASIPRMFYMSSIISSLDIAYAIPQVGVTQEELYSVFMTFLNEINIATNPLIAFCLNLIPVLVMVYVSMTKAVFYDIVSGNLIVEVRE